ncbi:MAG: DNA mismatch repair endonuclease MutL, partial [candidate division Zixibacteria bacterium]|nr:DNA mismatch repair endonuclease MutL [candidate division Zixibacteria bacterium]
GTSIIVREVFYNIPARRKFLKSILTETRHIIDLLTRFAVAYPEISFKLISDGRELFDFKAVNSLKQRVGDIFGKNQIEKMVEIQTETGTETETGHKRLNISGFLGKPEIGRSNRAELYLFVNRRPIVSRSLYHAVQIGYGELLPKGKFPFAIVFIEIDPGLVDVNVHPTKSEVRFSDEKGVHDLVYMKIKESLTSPEVMPTLSKLPESTMPQASASHDILRGWEPRLREVTTSEDITPTSSAPPKAESFDLPVAELPKTKGEEGIHRKQTQKSFFKEEVVEPESPKAQEIEEKKIPLSERPLEQVEDKLVEFAKVEKKVDAGAGNLWQLADTYILSQVKGNLMVLDQHAAHERILYEEAMKNLTQKPASSQQILFPTVLELSPREFQTFEVNKELIRKLGFEIKSFGGRSILVTAVPTIIRNKSGELFLKEILTELEEEEKVEKNKLKAVAKSFACHAAVKAGERLTQEEMSTLLHQLFATEEPYSCPHGRPTVVKISIDELNKKFGRG